MLRGAPTAVNPARQRRARVKNFPAPTAGWISNRNLASPNPEQMGQGAEILDNFFPTSSGAVLRRGKRRYATLGEGASTLTSMFRYAVGGIRKLFAANADTIYDLTGIVTPYNYTIAATDDDTLAASPTDTLGQNSTADREVFENTAGGFWSTVQFATTGDTFLIGVNGASEGFRYDGDAFVGLDTDAVKITFPAASGKTTADLSYVWTYKRRLFFIEKESLSVWFLPVDQIGGELVEFPLGGELNLGGSLLFGSGWSLEGGEQGGLSEQCVFISTEGEVVVYQGDNPAQASYWAKVGTYRIGRPLGYNAHVRAGGDLLIATSIGFIALSKAVQVDLAAISPTAVSASIEVAWNEAVQQRGLGWNCILWPEGQMVAVAPPTTSGTSPTLFVTNALTGAWAPFTNWDVTSFAVFEGRLFFGSVNGEVFEAMVTGSDDGIPYTGVYMPMFSDDGTPTVMKTARQARLTARSSAAINERLSCRFDFDKSLPPVPDVFAVSRGNEWDAGIWDVSVWSVGRDANVTQRRHSVSGYGYRIAPVLQITSGSTVPLDLELVALDVTYDAGDVFT